MSNMRSLLFKANYNVSGHSSGGWKRDAQRERTADAWFPVRVRDSHIEEDEVPQKRKKLVQSSKGKQTRVDSGSDPSREGELFQLPNIWSEPDRYVP